MPGDALNHLLRQIVDYAGLFPPARLDMGPAVEEFARHHASGDAWMLARFVVPASRLDAFESAAASFLPTESNATPWGLSVLPGDNLEAARQRIDAFNQTHGNPEAGLATVEAVEYRPGSLDDIARAARLFEDLEIYFELPHDVDPEPWMQEVAKYGGRGKIRSGGITSEAFPSAAEFARFLATAQKSGLPMKATAGLHHPLRGEYALTYEEASPNGTMHGFFNVFLAAAWARQGLDEASLAVLLEERDPNAFEIDGDSVRWREHVLRADEIADSRDQFLLSYGSCSFAEPVGDLRSLGWL